MIVDSYDALGAAAERADTTTPRTDFAGRWLTVCRAIRSWAVAHPHEYALLYGSPVPGYRAPQDTVPAATRVTAVLAGIVRDASAAGALNRRADEPPPPPALAADAARLREALMDGVADDAVLRSLLAWMAVFGAISFELFGHLNTVIGDYGEAFDHHVRQLGGYVGLGVIT